MVSAAQVMAGAAFVKVGADITDMQKGLKAAAKTFAGFIGRVGVAMQALGGSMLIPLYNSIKAYADYGNAVYDIAERTGVAQQSVAELGFATEAMGGSMDYFAKGMRFLQRNFAVAADGSKSMKKAFTDIGLTIDELKKKSPEELFMDTADAIGNIKNESKMVQSAIKIFGRGGSNLVEIFQLGKDGIEDFRKAYRYLHGELKADDAKEVEVRFKSLKMVWQGLQDTIANQLMPQFRKFTDMLIRAGVRIRMLLNDNPKLISQYTQLAFLLAKVGVAFVAISAAIIAISSPIIALTSIFSFATLSIVESMFDMRDGINDVLSDVFDSFTIFGMKFDKIILKIQKFFSASNAKFAARDLHNYKYQAEYFEAMARIRDAYGNKAGAKFFRDLSKRYIEKSKDAASWVEGWTQQEEALNKRIAESEKKPRKTFADWAKDKAKSVKDLWAEIKGDKPFDPKGEMAFKNMIARLTEAKKKLDTSLKSSEIKFGGSTVLTGSGNMMGRLHYGDTVAQKQLEEQRAQSEYLREIREILEENGAEQGEFA